MGSVWAVFCGESDCGGGGEDPSCGADLSFVTQPSSCINHVLIICFDLMLLVMFFFTMFFKKSLKSSQSFRNLSSLQLVSAIYNGFLGLAYLAFGVWILVEKLQKTDYVSPLHWWILYMFHGLVLLLIGLTVSLRARHFSRAPLRLLSVLDFLFAGITCGLSVFTAILREEMSVKITLDVLSFLGSSLLILCAYRGYKYQEVDDESGIHDPLLAVAAKTSSDGDVTPFAEAGFLSNLTFWWLNPLMKRGKEKTLEDKDMPKLRVDDRAESCYLLFTEIYNEKKGSDPSHSPSILKIILFCHWKQILISGFFACLKVIAISAGPMLLKAFINVAEGNASSVYEKYVLVATLFLTKIIESVAQRQWYFRSRLVGLKLRSLLTAAVYRKQLKLSNAARLMHSSGEIMSYVTVDAYRIGEFPFWFHQIWTTSLQLCLAVIILFDSVGLATIASIVVIVLTVLCNMPLAKLQHMFQSRLMEAQDLRLKAMSEALVNMKVLKLYAWETHFRHVVEKLRMVEDKCLSAVQLRKAYNSFLFWSSPVLVSAATFGACYVIGVPLSSSNVFTFVATLRLVQDPIRSIPDVLAVFIQAKVAFARIVKFLEAPELESANVPVKPPLGGKVSSVCFESADLSWDEDPLKPTLRNINLEVKQGDKIAICGEVGSGKSTLLAAVLREVPITRGSVSCSPLFIHFIVNNVY